MPVMVKPHARHGESGQRAVEDLRRVSKAVFGQAYRLELMAFIAQRQAEPFTLKDAVMATGVSSASLLQAPIKSLLEAGLLTPVQRDESRRYRHYAAVDSLAWDFALELFARSAA